MLVVKPADRAAANLVAAQSGRKPCSNDAVVASARLHKLLQNGSTFLLFETDVANELLLVKVLNFKAVASVDGQGRHFH